MATKTDAFIEMEKASGLSLLNESERNPMKTTSFVMGELVSAQFIGQAQDNVAKSLPNKLGGYSLFIGGSVTNDALFFSFRVFLGKLVIRYGASW